MQVGSLVECIKSRPTMWMLLPYIEWMPTEGETYTIREVFTENGETSVRLEEGVIGHNKIGRELAMVATSFREVQPPMDLTELLKETEPQTVLVTR